MICSALSPVQFLNVWEAFSGLSFENEKGTLKSKFVYGIITPRFEKEWDNEDTSGRGRYRFTRCVK